MINWIVSACKAVWKAFSHNLIYKLLSVAFAIMMWSFVIYSNPSITRDKLISPVDVTVSGQTVLASRGLALLTDVSTDLPQVRVRVEVAQSSYQQVSSENVRVELDLTSIRQTGQQQVKLTGSSSYGKVVQITPAYVDVNVEMLDQRYVPVNTEIVGNKAPNSWYSVTRINPSQITVSGPASLVQQVSSASVKVDVSDVSASQSRAQQFTLLDAQGEEMSGSVLVRSTNSITVGLDVYPTKRLPIAAETEKVVTGELPAGYRIESIEIEPEAVDVAGDETFLESLTQMLIEPIDVTGLKQTVSTQAALMRLKDVRSLSSEQVTVTIHIVQEDTTRRFSNVSTALVGAVDGVKVRWSKPKISVKVTGPYSVVESLARADILATVDVTGLASGEHELPIHLEVDNHPELVCESDPSVVKVVIP